MRSLHALAALAVAACSSTSTSGVASDGGYPADAAPPDSGASGDAVAPADASTSEGGGDTWTSYAKGFAMTYCVECHNAGDSQGRDYTKYSKVVAEKGVIRCGVCAAQDSSWNCPSIPAAKQFPIDDGKTPPNAKPSDAERTRFVAWLSAGAPQ